MYEVHPAIPEPGDGLVIRRYMDFPKFMSLLEGRALFFADPSSLGDPFEGALSSEVPKASLVHGDLRKGVKQVHELDTLKALGGFGCGVSCWHASPDESSLMWRVYGGVPNSIAIQSVFGTAKQAFCGPRSVYAGEVEYLDHSREPVRSNNIFHRVLRKREGFRDESELRFLCSVAPPGFARPGDPVPNTEESRLVSVDLNVLIGKVVVSPHADPWFHSLVVNFAEMFGLREKVERSQLSGTPIFHELLIVAQD